MVAGITLLLLLFFLPLLGILFGGFSGWVVGFKSNLTQQK